MGRGVGKLKLDAEKWALGVKFNNPSLVIV